MLYLKPSGNFDEIFEPFGILWPEHFGGVAEFPAVFGCAWSVHPAFGAKRHHILNRNNSKLCGAEKREPN